jgi:NAD(P)-dependent dehydrogenase (short-subunit alcohol dehydrogenase family)
MSEQGRTERVAIVTGGSRGIGRETAVRLGRDGYAVVVTYGGNKAEADAAVEEVTGAGGRAIAVQADVADEVAVASLFDQAEQTFGGVDVVVHAAGVMLLPDQVRLPYVRRLRRDQGRCRGTHPDSGPRAARPGHHGERRRPRPNRHRALPRREVGGADQQALLGVTAGTPRPAGGCR